jgi:hypothetical protein
MYLYSTGLPLCTCVQGLGWRFGVWGSGFEAKGLGFRVWGLGFRV